MGAPRAPRGPEIVCLGGWVRVREGGERLLDNIWVHKADCIDRTKVPRSWWVIWRFDDILFVVVLLSRFEMSNILAIQYKWLV